MELLLITVAAAVGLGYILFYIYHLLLLQVLKFYKLDLDKLKTHDLTPTIKRWNSIISVVVYSGLALFIYLR